MARGPDYYTTGEVARSLGVDPATVRRWVINGRVKPSLTLPSGHHRFTHQDLVDAGIAVQLGAA